MLRLWAILLALVLSGCGSLGYNSLDEEVRKQESIQVADSQRKTLLKQHYEKGELLYKEGKLDEASREFNAMLKLSPNDEAALYRMGTISFKLQKFEDAATYFDHTVKANPRNGKAHYNLASVRLLQAENHYKYYAAQAGKDQDLSNVTELLGNIDKFNNGSKPEGMSGSLDKIAGALKK